MKNTTHAVLAVVAAIAVALFAACGDDDSNTVPDLTWEQLRNGTYPSAVNPGQVVTLVNGRDSVAEEGATPSARLVDIGAFGEIGGDRGVDAAVFLAEATGDGRQVTSLMAVVNDGGKPRVDGSFELGENAAIRKTGIEDEKIDVREVLADSMDTDAGEMQERLREFTLGDNGLEMTHDGTLTVELNLPAEFEYERTLLEPTAGKTMDRVLGPRGVVPLVIDGVAGQRVAISLTSEHDSAVLSIQGLSDESQVVALRDYRSDYSAEFETTQQYAVRVISLLGSDLEVSLRYELAEPPAPTATPAPAPPPQTTTDLAGTVPVLFEGTPALSDAPLAELSATAAEFMPGRDPLKGIAVVVPGDGATYVDNADEQMETASVIKMVVMTCVMHRAELHGRLVDEWELSLMWPMITESNNDATDALWADLGGGPGVAACLQEIGASGITPYNGVYWGTSTASARGMATLMARLAYGDVVVPEHRAAALEMLVSVIPGQRWGVPAGADADPNEIVGVKDGWYPDEDGWRVNSVGFISPLAFGDVSYAIAVMTNQQSTQEYGIATIEGLALPAWTDIRARQ